MKSGFHVPVLPEQIMEYMITDASGIYIDCTLGGGGHARYILNKLNSDARYFGIDQDKNALDYAKSNLSNFTQVYFIHDNFKNLNEIFIKNNLKFADGILLDLGVSSFQIDSNERGFSYMADTLLDMRMDQNTSITAQDIINDYSEKNLIEIFKKYGEERKAKIIAGLIIQERKKKRIESTEHLKNIIERVVHPKFKIKSFARIFQALRIEVNQELQNLNSVLHQAFNLLSVKGRLLVISYHSLEDRMVKQFFKQKANPCICPEELPVCACGNVPEINILTKKAVKAKAEEIANNNRARSALLRVGEKI